MPPRAIINRSRHWLDRSIYRRLIVWSIFFWLISVSSLGLTFLRVGQTQILDEAHQRNVQFASVVSRDVGAQIGTLLSDLRMFSRHLELLSPDLESQANAMLALRLSSPQRHRALYYFENDSDLAVHLTDSLANLLAMRSAADIVSRAPIQPGDEVNSSYRAARETGTGLSDVIFTGMDRIPVMYVGMPIGVSGGNTRVIVHEIDLRGMWQRIELSMIGRSGFAYAVSEKGVIIAHPDQAYLGRRIPAEIEPLLMGYEGSIAYTEPVRQRRVLAAYSPVGGSTGWGIVVQQDESELNAAVFRTGLFVVGVWVTLAIAGTLGILVVVGNFTRPIEDLTRTTQHIARTGTLTRTTTAHKHDEIGQLSQAFDQMIERLQTTEGRLATVAAEERNRLARDLHDAVTQTLFAASLIAEVLPVLWERNQKEGRKRLEELRQLTRGALAEMRTLLLELRPAAMAEAELAYLLRQLAESIAGRSRVPVTVTVDGQCSLPNKVKVALYRIAQEALNNMAKHAEANEAKVVLLYEPGQVTLNVTDDGRGFDVTSTRPDSLGLGIMRERARDIGASLSVHSGVGHGTDISAVWKNGAGEGTR